MSKQQNLECVGSLIITHSNIKSLGDYKKIRLPGGNTKMAFPWLIKGYKVLRQNVVIQLEGEGNCCWEIFDRPNFRNEANMQMIYPGDPSQFPMADHVG